MLGFSPNGSESIEGGQKHPDINDSCRAEVATHRRPTLIVDVIKAVYEDLPRAIVAYIPHGGHLGFFEPSWCCPLWPKSQTWTDRLIIEYFNVILGCKGE